MCFALYGCFSNSPSSCIRPRYKTRVDPTNNKNLFTIDTYKTVQECIKKSKYLQDPKTIPLGKMYGAVAPTARTKHKLSFKLSLRGESHVESSQGQQQHFANVGMWDEVADQYILRGTCRGNARICAKLLWNEQTQEKREAVPSFLRGEPLHFDHVLLASINGKIKASGSDWVPFKNLFDIKEDNGEAFLSAYYRQQQVRNNNTMVNKLNSRCQCIDCAANPVDLPWKVGHPAAFPRPTSTVAPTPLPHLPPMILDPLLNDSDDGGFQFSDDDSIENEESKAAAREMARKVERPPIPQKVCCYSCFYCVVGHLSQRVCMSSDPIILNNTILGLSTWHQGCQYRPRIHTNPCQPHNSTILSCRSDS